MLPLNQLLAAIHTKESPRTTRRLGLYKSNKIRSPNALPFDFLLYEDPNLAEVRCRCLRAILLSVRWAFGAPLARYDSRSCVKSFDFSTSAFTLFQQTTVRHHLVALVVEYEAMRIALSNCPFAAQAWDPRERGKELPDPYEGATVGLNKLKVFQENVEQMASRSVKL